jgi:hypothetical protein
MSYFSPVLSNQLLASLALNLQKDKEDKNEKEK